MGKEIEVVIEKKKWCDKKNQVVTTTSWKLEVNSTGHQTSLRVGEVKVRDVSLDYDWSWLYFNLFVNNTMNVLDFRSLSFQYLLQKLQ